MSDALTQQAEEIATLTLECTTPSERKAFWDRACCGDAALRAAVEKIWEEYSEAEQFFEHCKPSLACSADLYRTVAKDIDSRSKPNPATGRRIDSHSSAPTTILELSDRIPGSQIGPYKLLQKIGEGGCGVVYMAEQEKPVRRRVALKVIKLGMDTKNVIARFEAERQALALMDHPNIARVLDAGATETGRPYFVMELVRGTRITHYCDEHRLDVHRRLELFQQICGAIQHAHQKGIVHRDIKPSNILVTTLNGEPAPKVIDFGIAKATGGERLTDNTLFTAFEQFVGTPAYMSPEQAQRSGMDVDTRSDIYSLGVLLYELLTGKTPFDQTELLKSGLDEMRRTLMEREPHRPSTRLNALREDELTQTTLCRQVESPKLKSLLKGDLDWIVMKALEKDRNRRYQTVNGLAMDIQRYLNNEAVFARPPSRVYRLQKLIRRNRSTFAAIAAVTVALIAGFGTSTWMFLRERAARREADLLRTEANARAQISEAALLINRHQMAEADRLVERLQIPVAEPSFEAAGVFRALGEWNVSQGRWEIAADRFLQLGRANQVDKSDTTADVSRDLLGTGPALIMAGRLDSYRQFVRESILRFAETKDATAAEQVVKNSLILPADLEVLQQLEPFIHVVDEAVNTGTFETEPDGYLLGWRTLAITLFEHRRGNLANAIFWGRRCLEYPDPPPARRAMAHLVLALAHHGLHQAEAARAELASGRRLLDERFPTGMQLFSDLGSQTTGVWHDWVIARLLLREAESTIRLF